MTSFGLTEASSLPPQCKKGFPERREGRYRCGRGGAGGRGGDNCSPGLVRETDKGPRRNERVPALQEHVARVYYVVVFLLRLCGAMRHCASGCATKKLHGSATRLHLNLNNITRLAIWLGAQRSPRLQSEVFPR